MNKHWTENSVIDYQSRITFDFLAQLEQQMDVLPLSQAELARKLGVGESAVSQILNNPANLELKTIIKYSRALGLKVAVVAYNDHDPGNERGPVNSEIFTLCWERQGKPVDFFELNEQQQRPEFEPHYFLSDTTKVSIVVKKHGNAISTDAWNPVNEVTSRAVDERNLCAA